MDDWLVFSYLCTFRLYLLLQHFVGPLWILLLLHSLVFLLVSSLLRSLVTETRSVTEVTVAVMMTMAMAMMMMMTAAAAKGTMTGWARCWWREEEESVTEEEEERNVTEDMVKIVTMTTSHPTNHPGRATASPPSPTPAPCTITTTTYPPIPHTLTTRGGGLQEPPPTHQGTTLGTALGGSKTHFNQARNCLRKPHWANL